MDITVIEEQLGKPMSQPVIDLTIQMMESYIQDRIQAGVASLRKVIEVIEEENTALRELNNSLRKDKDVLVAEKFQLKTELASQSWTTNAGAHCNKHAFELMRLEPQMNDLLRNNKHLTKTILKIQAEIKYYKENMLVYRGSPIDNIIAIIEEYLTTKE